MSERARLHVIDAFRGVAILSVMAFHFTVALTGPLSPFDAYGYDHRFSPLLEVGRYGVQLFFVISGLVIAQTLVRTDSLGAFAWKRFARLYPAFLAALTLSMLLLPLIGEPLRAPDLGDILANLTMAAPHFGRHWVDPVYWTLLVELKFYVVAGLAYALLGRRFWIGVLGFALAGSFLATLRPWGAHIWFIADYMPFFLAGIGLWLASFDKRPRAGLICLVAGIGLYAFWQIGFGPGCTPYRICLHNGPRWLSQLFVLVSVGALLALVAGGVTGAPRWLAWIGRISYSLYLVHSYVGLMVIRIARSLGAPDLVAIAFAAAAAIGAAALMFRYVEEPGHQALLGLRRRREPKSAYPMPAE